MIRIATKEDWDLIHNFVNKDYARNYFIALSMIKGPDVFKNIYLDIQGEVKSILFHRASNNLQYVQYVDYDTSDMNALINKLDFEHMIAPKTYCHQLTCLKVKKHGAIISKLTEETYQKKVVNHIVNRIAVEDCDQIETLYRKVFPGHPRAAFMKEKLKANRGIGYCIQSDQIHSVAQSEFGYVIVGVATDPNHQHQGMASSCIHQLIQTLLKEYPALYLQYDDEIAGQMYISIGFKPIDQVNHYKKR